MNCVILYDTYIVQVLPYISSIHLHEIWGFRGVTENLNMKASHHLESDLHTCALFLSAIHFTSKVEAGRSEMVSFQSTQPRRQLESIHLISFKGCITRVLSHTTLLLHDCHHYHLL